MSDETPRLKLAQLVSLQELNTVTWNEALAQLDALADLYLLGQFVNDPPSSPSDGDAYLVGGSPTDAWSGYAYKIAACLDGAWRFYAPFNGLKAYVVSTGAFVVYLDGAWIDVNSLISSSEVSIASAAACDLGAAGSLFVAVTGTTAIASFGSDANKLRFVRFADALTLTHNATSLILLGGASRTTAAGDIAVFTSDASGNWRERSYCRAASDPGDYATRSGTETLTNKTMSGASNTFSAIPNSALANASITICGHAVALGGAQTLAASDVGLGNVANEAQTKAAIVPNTVPAAGQILVGNGTAYTPATLSGDASLAAGGALTVSKLNGKAVSLGGSLTLSGAYAFTGSLSGTTSVTFPASGTLATLAGSETLSNKTLSGNTILNGKLGINVTNPQYAIDASVQGVNFGGDIGSYSTRTSSVSKAGFFSVPVYASSSYQPVLALSAICSSTDNNLCFGGGSGSYSCATQVQFYTGAVNSTATTPRFIIDSAGHLVPGATNSYNIGSASCDLANGWIHNAWTVTSDKNLKTNVRSFSAAEIAAAKDLAALLCLWQWKDSVAAKGGEAARLHSGIPAQDARDVLVRHGLDAAAYGWYCADPLTQQVRKTRTVRRQQRAAVAVAVSHGEFVEQDGKAVFVSAVRLEEREELVWTNERSLPACDADGNPLLDETGAPKTVCFRDPVMEDVEEEYFDTEPVCDDSGAPVMRYAIRYTDLHNWLLAALWQHLAVVP